MEPSDGRGPARAVHLLKKLKLRRHVSFQQAQLAREITKSHCLQREQFSSGFGAYVIQLQIASRARYPAPAQGDWRDSTKHLTDVFLFYNGS